MEKAWTELKKIETEASLIRSEGIQRGKEIIEVATEEAGKLVSNSEAYAIEQVKRLDEKARKEAQEKRHSQLKSNKKALEKLKANAMKHMEEAEKAIFEEILGNSKP
jgi:vacuolar-type H+-ATPase subunit H